MLGKHQKTLELKSEETALKQPFPCSALGTNDFEAGCIASYDTSAYVAKCNAVAGAIQTAAAPVLGIFFDTKNGTTAITGSNRSTAANIDETEGSGLCTVIVNKHVGKTRHWVATSSASFTKGARLKSSANGTFDVTSTAGEVLAICLGFDGDWLTYMWL